MPRLDGRPAPQPPLAVCLLRTIRVVMIRFIVIKHVSQVVAHTVRTYFLRWVVLRTLSVHLCPASGALYQSLGKGMF